MPKRSPFTRLCGTLAALGPLPRADLHTHSTASDGALTPSQVVACARAARLAAVALTDHDTLAGLAEARAAAEGTGVELVPGVEISTAFAGRELHLLGYFVRPHADLCAALHRLCEARRERFRSFVAHFRASGLAVPEDRAALIERGTHSPGRRHVARLLVECGAAGSRHEAFVRFVAPAAARVAPKELLPVDAAVALVRAAGGVASLAHPPADLTDAHFAELAATGLGALETVYPWPRASVGARLRAVAARHGLAVSGGSDSHGAPPADRAVGSTGVTLGELGALRAAARTGEACAVR